MELSFIDEEIIMDINERMMQKVFKDILDVDIPLPMPRMTYKEAMERFGSDKPDVRWAQDNPGRLPAWICPEWAFRFRGNFRRPGNYE